MPAIQKIDLHATRGYYFSLSPNENHARLKAGTGQTLILFNAHNTQPSSAGIALAGPALSTNIMVHVRVLPSHVQGSRNTLTALTQSNIRFTSSTFEISDSDPNVICFHVSINPDQYPAPWSINELVEFHLGAEGQEGSTALGAVRLEIYGLCGTLPPYLVQGGVPVRVLRLFLPGIPNRGVRTEKDWIAWVARICHGTQDPKQPHGQPRETSKKHWLKYHVWSGGSSFVQENDVDFCVDEWIDAYDNWVEDANCFTAVNCFDQAGIVQIVLSLGVPFGRIFREHRQPFGYIAHTDLVGWGKTNNPYFEGDNSMKNLVDPKDIRRSPFRNHVFVSISPVDGEYDDQTVKIIDTCTGPFIGTLTYDEYLAQVVDPAGDMIKLSDVDENIWHDAGITGTASRCSSPHILNDLIRDHFGGDKENLDEYVNKIRTIFAGQMLSPSFDAGFVLHTVDALLDHAKEILADPPDEKIAAPTPKTLERKWLARVVSDDPEIRGYWSFISFKISRYRSVDEAVDALDVRLRCMTPPTNEGGMGTVRVKNWLDTGVEDESIDIFGNLHLSVFVYKNALVEVSGNAVRGYINLWTARFLETIWHEDARTGGLQIYYLINYL
ncbi:hypothetical protein B0T22DRAFT_458137 [Podospora appendiculata]|uniref:Uncharacterized protein n=1 Tax=Podospora appendiculata TaxID=314037 RepID=A0AAE1CBR7_9PEZI|nr:hypothetical protein B0T22DRAFT_458137 [Podospora appendiculata]